MQKLKPYLHYLIGCNCKVTKQYIYDNAGKIELPVKNLTLVLDNELFYKTSQGLIEFKPVLRPISDMTDKEKFDLEVYQHSCFKKLRAGAHYNTHKTALVTKWYLDNHFDIFDLIGQGLADDETDDVVPATKETYEKN